MSLYFAFQAIPLHGQPYLPDSKSHQALYANPNKEIYPYIHHHPHKCREHRLPNNNLLRYPYPTLCRSPCPMPFLQMPSKWDNDGLSYQISRNGIVPTTQLMYSQDFHQSTYDIHYNLYYSLALMH